jgi:hypothetical protein
VLALDYFDVAFQILEEVASSRTRRRSSRCMTAKSTGPNLHEQGAHATNPLVAATICELLCPSGKPAPAPRSRSPERGRSRPTEPA